MEGIRRSISLGTRFGVYLILQVCKQISKYETKKVKFSLSETLVPANRCRRIPASTRDPCTPLKYPHTSPTVRMFGQRHESLADDTILFDTFSPRYESLA